MRPSTHIQIVALIVPLFGLSGITNAGDCEGTLGDVTIADIAAPVCSPSCSPAPCCAPPSNVPTWGINNSKMVVKSIGGHEIRVAPLLTAGSGPFWCSIYRSIDGGAWSRLVWYQTSCSGGTVNEFSVGQPSQLIIDNDDYLHVVHPAPTGTTYPGSVVHWRFNGIETAGTLCHPEVIDTTDIVAGSDEKTLQYFGAAYDAGYDVIWLVYSAYNSDANCAKHTRQLRAASFQTSWQESEFITSTTGKSFHYPCVSLASGPVHVLVSRLDRCTGRYDGVFKYSRQSGVWGTDFSVTASSPTGDVALFGCDLLQDDDDNGNPMALVYCNSSDGGPAATGVYLLYGNNWALSNGSLADSTFKQLSNLALDSAGRTWIVGHYGGNCIAYKYLERSRWSSPLLIDTTLSAMPVSVKRKSGSDWLDHLVLCYSTDYDNPLFTGAKAADVEPE